MRRHNKIKRYKYMYMRQQYSNEMLKTRLEIQEESSRAISREIHDNIGQALSFIKLNLGMFTDELPAGAREKINESKNLLTKSIQDLRDIARKLNPDFIAEAGLPATIEKLLLYVARDGTYKTSFLLTGEVYKNPVQYEMVIYRTIQELLYQVAKNTDGGELSITFQYQLDGLDIFIKTDANTIDYWYEAAAIQKRLRMIKAEVSVNKDDEAVPAVIIHLPKTGTTVND